LDSLANKKADKHITASTDSLLQTYPPIIPMNIVEIRNRKAVFFNTESNTCIEPVLGGIWKASRNYQYSGWKHFKKCKLTTGENICVLVPDVSKLNTEILDLTNSREIRVAGTDRHSDLTLVTNIVVR
jgi:hypothetical protein